MKRIITYCSCIVAMLWCSLLLGANLPNQDIQISEKVYSNAYDGYVSIRVEPSSKSEKIGEFRNGPDGAILLEKTNEYWWKIDNNGIVGFVSNSNLQSTPTKTADPNITVEWLTVEGWGCGNDNIGVTFNSDGTFECMGCVDGTGTWRIEETNIIFTLVESDGYKVYFDEPFPVDYVRKKIGELTRNDVTTQQMATTEAEDIPIFTPYTSVPDDLDWIYGYWKSDYAGDLADVSRDGTIKYANAVRSGNFDVCPDYDALEKKSFVVGKYHYSFDNTDYMALSIANGEDYLLIDPNNKALFYFYDFDYPNRFEKISDITYAETLIQEQKEALKAKILKIVSIVVMVLLLIGLLLLLCWGIKKLIVYAKTKKEATLAAVAQTKEKARILAEQVKEQAVKSKDKIASYNNTQSEYGWLKATKWMIITPVVILSFIDILIGLILLTLSILLRKHLKKSPEYAQNLISKISLNPTKYIMWVGILIGFIIFQLISFTVGLLIMIASICYSFVSKKQPENVYWIYKRINQFISCICNSYKDRCLILAIGILLLIINQLFSGLITILAIVLFVLFLIAIYKNRNFHIVDKLQNYYIKFRESSLTERLGNWWQNKAVRICSIGLSIILVLIFTTNTSMLNVGTTMATTDIDNVEISVASTAANSIVKGTWRCTNQYGMHTLDFKPGGPGFGTYTSVFTSFEFGNGRPSLELGNYTIKGDTIELRSTSGEKSYVKIEGTSLGDGENHYRKL